MTHAAPIQVQRDNKTFTIQSERGVITITQSPAAAGTEAQRVVGAGIALAATAGGRYILALAPKANPDPNGMAIEPVVYTVTW
jgi:DNA-binding IclR family transcriptional regulator